MGGGSTGYETASGIIAADQDALETENIKSTAVLKGNIVLNTAKVNNETGEIAGVFESVQPSDTAASPSRGARWLSDDTSLRQRRLVGDCTCGVRPPRPDRECNLRYRGGRIGP